MPQPAIPGTVWGGLVIDVRTASGWHGGAEAVDCTITPAGPDELPSLGRGI